MVEHILGLSRELDLIDELGRQFTNDRFDAQQGQQVEVNREPMTAAALNVRLALGRDDRCAAMVACSVAAHSPRNVRRRHVCAGLAAQHARSASSRTISSAKNGLPAAPRRSSGPPRQQLGPAEQLGDQCRSLRITQRRKGYRLRTGTRVPPRTRGGR